MLTNTGMLMLGFGFHAAGSAAYPVAIEIAVPWWEDPDCYPGA